jgi:hypothetical protein
MGKIGYGDGSEFHLLRWMGRHRSEINRLVLASLDKEGSDINWLDFPFAGSGKSLDAEWKGLDFLPKNSSIKKQWADFWPTGKGIHNWDLVGRLNKSDKAEWILVEAKAHIGEINSSCTATAQQSINKIAEAFESVKKSFGVDKARNWMSPYYQHTNRISVLWFLHQHDIPAKLLFIYFCGDKRPTSHKKWPTNCPQDQEGWRKALHRQDTHVGLPKQHPLASHIHKLFLPVIGGALNNI